MRLHFPSLLPALAGLAAYATTIEIGPHLSSLLIALANIGSAAILATIHARYSSKRRATRRTSRKRKQVSRQLRK